MLKLVLAFRTIYQFQRESAGDDLSIGGFRSPQQSDPLIEPDKIELSHEDITTIEGAQ